VNSIGPDYPDPPSKHHLFPFLVGLMRYRPLLFFQMVK
jgi:hypothetical protein